MRHITKDQLNQMFSIAKQNLIDLDDRKLDKQQFLSVCWTKAVLTVLNINMEVIFPIQKIPEPEE